MVKHGKRYNEALDKLDKERNYEPGDAINLIKETTTAKFDETVEVHLRTGADPRHAEQQIRGVAQLPNGLGKPVRVLVFAQGDAAKAARDAGADSVGDDDVIQKVDGGWVDFDMAIATPDMMGKIGRLGRVLGRRGLMPNPRTGTVVQAEDIPRAVDEAKKGRVEVRMDRTAIIHVPIGKASFESDKLLENLSSLMDMISRSKPTSVKGQFIRSAYLTSSMGPSVPLDVATLTDLKIE